MEATGAAQNLLHWNSARSSLLITLPNFLQLAERGKFPALECSATSCGYAERGSVLTRLAALPTPAVLRLQWQKPKKVEIQS
jgi:hypothetical protein